MAGWEIPEQEEHLYMVNSNAEFSSNLCLITRGYKGGEIPYPLYVSLPTVKTNKGGPSFSEGKSRMMKTYLDIVACTWMFTPVIAGILPKFIAKMSTPWGGATLPSK